jgi:hypothetical protein
MKNRLKTLDYNGTGIVFTADGWLNATASAQALGKTDLDNFLRSKSYAEYAEVVAQANSVKSTELKQARQGNGGGTFLHPEMAVVFARWISPAFAYWCDKQVATLIRLAQEAPARNLQLRTKRMEKLGRPAEAIAKRNEGVTNRLIFTNRLQVHGVQGNGFQECTRAIYFPLFGGSTSVIKKNYNLPERANVRDYMTPVQLATLSLAESLAAERIEKERAYGNTACVSISNQVGQAMAKAVGNTLRGLSS